MFCKIKFIIRKGASIVKFLRTLILKNICEWLLLKISISVINSESVVQRCSVKKVLIEISQNYNKTPVPESLMQSSCRPETLAQVFSCEFVKFLSRPFSIEPYVPTPKMSKTGGL